MTEVLHRREKELKRVGQNSYYDSDFIKHLVTDNHTNELWSFLNTQVQFKVDSKAFVEMHPSYCIPGFGISEHEEVVITEYAP